LPLYLALLLYAKRTITPKQGYVSIDGFPIQQSGIVLQTSDAVIT